MKIIYFSWSGVHSAAVAGALHLGKIPVNGFPRLEDVPFFGFKKVKYQILFLGRDQYGNEIFSLGAGRELALVERSMKDFLLLSGVASGDLCVINTLAPLGNLCRMGEFLACYGLVAIGNLIFRAGLKRDFTRFSQHLKKTATLPILD